MDQAESQSLSLEYALLAGLIVVLLAAAAGVWWLLRRRAVKGTTARLRQACEDLLSSVLIPNAETGQIHIEYALLASNSIVVVDVRDVAGHVFGSETMHEWTVLDAGRRSTFPNPLPVLYDRVAAVRRLLPDVTVRGYVVFTSKAQFNKGLPPNVALMEGFVAGLIAENNAATESHPRELLAQAWAKLRAQSSGSAK